MHRILPIVCFIKIQTTDFNQFIHLLLNIVVPNIRQVLKLAFKLSFLVSESRPHSRLSLVSSNEIQNSGSYKSDGHFGAIISSQVKLGKIDAKPP